MLLSLVTALSILTFYIAGYYKSDPYQYRVTGALVEALLILAMAAWNGYLYQREQKMTLYEMTTRATTIIDALERSGMNMVQVKRGFMICGFFLLTIKSYRILVYPLYRQYQ